MKPTLLFLLLLFAPIISAAQSEQRDLKTLLQDSAYLFNRYDEITTGMDTEIDDWNVPTSLKTSLKKLLSVSALNLSTEKPKLNALLSKNDLSASELFDVYSEVEDLGGQLSEQSSNFSQFGNDQGKAVELAELSAKAGILGANISYVLQIKIMDLEYQLAACKIGQSAPAARHK